MNECYGNVLEKTHLRAIARKEQCLVKVNMRYQVNKMSMAPLHLLLCKTEKI